MACRPGSPGLVAVALDKPEGYTSAGVYSSQYDILLFTSKDPTSESALAQKSVLTGHLSEVCALSFAPSGELLASADSSKTIKIWNMLADPVVVIKDLVLHTSRVSCLAWFPDSKRLASGGLDRTIYVWNVEEGGRETIQEAHKGGVTALAICGEDSFASVGDDGFLL